MSSRIRRKLRRLRERIEPQIEVEQKKVAILTPAGDLVHTTFAFNLSRMILHTLTTMDEPMGLTLQSYGSSMIPHSRQKLATWALEVGCTHMLWIDSDMEFPADMLLRFLRHSEPIVGINACQRRPPYLNTAQSEPHKPLPMNLESRGLEKVWRTGFGVMWTASEVFRKLEPPWFELQWIPESAVFRGEDYVFCEKARAAGYEIYVDHDLSREINHLGVYGFNPLMKVGTQAT